MFKKDTIRGPAGVEDLGGLKSSQVDLDAAADLRERLVARLMLHSSAMVVDGDGVYPAYDRPLFPELIELLPTLQPGGLGDILRAFQGGAPRTQQAHGSYEAQPVRLSESFLSHGQDQRAEIR